MKRCRHTFICLVLFLSLLNITAWAAPLETGFTYQGVLQHNSAPANGLFDFQVALYTADTGGTLIGTDEINDADVSEGIFTLELDFDATPFADAEQYWLEIRVSPDAPTEGYTTLLPRQKLTAVPYALTVDSLPASSVSATEIAANAVDSDEIASNAVGSSEIDSTQVQARVSGFCNPGSSIRSIGSSGTVVCETDDVANAWLLNGNSGTTPGTDFIGTTDNKALEFKVNNLRVMELEPNTISPNIIAGHPSNVISAGVRGAVIGGGGAGPNTDPVVGLEDVNRVTSHYGVVGGGYANQADGTLATVAGGGGNIASGFSSTVAGGSTNTASGGSSAVSGGVNNNASGLQSMIGGGFGNSASGEKSTVDGGLSNVASALESTVGGGSGNFARGRNSTIPGGRGNRAGGDYSFAAGLNARVRDASETSEVDSNGDCNVADGECGDEGTFVWAGSVPGTFTSTGSSQFLVLANNGFGLNENAPLAGKGLHIQEDDLSLTTSALNGEVILVEAEDAVLGLYSTSGGTYASTISLGEIDGSGDLEDKWSIGRRTTATSTGNLEFRFGTDDNYANNSRFMTLTSGGLLGVSRVPTTNRLEVNGNASKSSAGSWLANSDAAIKTDVEAIPDALETLQRVRPVRFRYNKAYREAHPELEDKIYYNVIAQEFAKVFPGAVKKSGERLAGESRELLQVDVHPALITAIAAIQELNEKLETENAALRAKMAKLEAALANHAALNTRLQTLESRIDALLQAQVVE